MTRSLGIDVGTSGVRAAIVDASKRVVGYAAEPFAPAGARDPLAWLGAVEAAIAQLDLKGVGAIAIDGTCLRAKADADSVFGYALLQRISGVLLSRLQSTRVRLLDLYGHSLDD